jgi:hypothetical protein
MEVCNKCKGTGSKDYHGTVPGLKTHCDCAEGQKLTDKMMADLNEWAKQRGIKVIRGGCRVGKTAD